MILKEFDLSVRLPQERSLDTGIALVQNDKDVYKLNVRVFDGVSEIDYTQVTSATITFLKADKNVVQGDMAVEADKLSYVLGTNEIAYPGWVQASVQLLGATERLSTAKFVFRVESDLVSEKAVKSTSEFPLLQRIAEDVGDIVPLIPEIEQTVQEFPEIRDFFDTAEVSETQRIQNENTRQTQEVARQASIADIEDRFDDLTSQQQQDAEVIDARMGKVSLRKKLEDMDATTAAHLAENANKAHGGFKGVLLGIASNQSIPNDANTTVVFGNHAYNDFGMWSVGTPTRITIPNGITKVKVSASCRFFSNATGRRRILIQKNGVYSNQLGLPWTTTDASGTGSMSEGTMTIESAVLPVSPGDFFEVAVRQTSGGALNLLADNYTWFSLEVVE